MTKEITKAAILQEMQDKLKLREFDPAKFLFEETVMPIYNIEQHLTREEVRENTVLIDSSPNAFFFFKVPQDERWILNRYNMIFQTGAYTITGLMIYRPTVTEYIYLDMELGQSASYLVDLPKTVRLQPGDYLYVYADGKTTNGNLNLRIDITVEVIR